MKWEEIDMNWIIGAACILAVLAVLGIFTAGVAVTIAEEREKITVLNIETFSPELAEVYL